MLSFEFSAFDLVLSIGMVVLILLFVTTIWKLNPSNENKQPRDEEVCEQEQESPLIPHEPNEPEPYYSLQTAEGATSQKTQQAPKLLVGATVEGTSHESFTQALKPSENREPLKPPKTTTSTKQISKSADEKGCLHHFGYLNELPKNTPIPGECFGCPKIVDCLITKKGR